MTYGTGEAAWRRRGCPCGVPGAGVSEESAEEVFQRLFAQYEQPIYQYVYRLLGDAEDARDFT